MPRCKALPTPTTRSLQRTVSWRFASLGVAWRAVSVPCRATPARPKPEFAGKVDQNDHKDEGEISFCDQKHIVVNQKKGDTDNEQGDRCEPHATRWQTHQLC